MSPPHKHNHYLLPLVFLLTISLSTVSFGQAPADHPILPKGAKVKEIFNKGESFLEGPAMSPNGILYFSDIPFNDNSGKPSNAGIIWALNPQTGVATIFRSPSGMSNGLAFDSNGDLVACEGANFGGRGVTRTDMKTGKAEVIAGLFEGRPFNAPNDIDIGTNGRIYFSDPRYLGNEPIEQLVMGVYVIEDKSVRLVAANVTKPNGIIISPDQKTLYVAECDEPGNGMLKFTGNNFPAVRPTPGPGTLVIYSILENGSLEFKKKVGCSDGLRIDGMTVDTEGNIYAAFGERLEVLNSEGNKIASIDVPAATNVCFGRGAFSKTLFIAAGKSVYSIETKKEGFHIPLKK